MKENILTGNKSSLLAILCPLLAGSRWCREGSISGRVSAVQIAFGIRVWLRLVQFGLDMSVFGHAGFSECHEVVPRSCFVFERPLVDSHTHT